MIDTGNTTLVQKMVGFATGGRFGGTAAAQPRTPPAQAAMIWLAGGSFKPKRSKDALRSASRQAQSAADEMFEALPPEDAVEAAEMRSDLLHRLHEEAADDPRVQDIFLADPVVVYDRGSRMLVTEKMLAARIGHFDVVATLFGRDPAGSATRAEMRTHLIEAFPVLSADAQREWALSEMRLEQAVRFVDLRSGAELRELTTALEPVFAQRGLWEVARLFTHAVEVGLARQTDGRKIGDLLEVRESLLAA